MLITIEGFNFSLSPIMFFRRVTQQYLEHIREYQAGFRPDRSNLEEILYLKLLRRQHININKVGTFIDFQKAFDVINHGLFYKL